MSNCDDQPYARKRGRDEPETTMKQLRVEGAGVEGDEDGVAATKCNNAGDVAKPHGHRVQVAAESNNSTNGGAHHMKMFNNVRLDADTDPKDVPTTMFGAFVAAVRSSDHVQQLWGTTMLSKLLLASRAVIDKVIDAGLTRELKSLLSDADDEVKVSAAKVLGYVAVVFLEGHDECVDDGESDDSDEQSDIAIDFGTYVEERSFDTMEQFAAFEACIPLFVKYGRSSNMALREACCKALCNIACATIGGSTIDSFLNNGALRLILEVIEGRCFMPSLAVEAATAIHLFFDVLRLNQVMASSTAHVVPAVPVLGKLIEEHTDEEVVEHALRAISTGSDYLDQDALKRAFVTADVVSNLQRVLHRRPSFFGRALEILARCIRAQVVSYEEGMNVFRAPLESADLDIRNTTCGILNDTLANGVPECQAVVDAGLVPLVIEAMKSAHLLRGSKSMAASLMVNLAKNASNEQLKQLVQDGGCLREMVPFLDSADPELVDAALEFLVHYCRATHHGSWLLPSDGERTTSGKLQSYLPPLWRLRFDLWVTSLSQHQHVKIQENAKILCLRHRPLQRSALAFFAKNGKADAVHSLLQDNFVSVEECSYALLVASRGGKTDVLAQLTDACVTASCHAFDFM